MDNNGRFKAVDLQAFADFVLNKDAGKIPEFIRESDKMVAEALFHYTEDVMKRDGRDAREVMENQAGALLDAVSKACYAYLENGMKFGAELLLQLLGGI